MSPILSVYFLPWECCGHRPGPRRAQSHPFGDDYYQLSNLNGVKRRGLGVKILLRKEQAVLRCNLKKRARRALLANALNGLNESFWVNERIFGEIPPLLSGKDGQETVFRAPSPGWEGIGEGV
jgi:hypothetical protein